MQHDHVDSRDKPGHDAKSARPGEEECAPGRSRRRVFAPRFHRRPSVFVSVPLAFSSEVKGWRLFLSRTLGAPFVRPWRPQSPITRKGNRRPQRKSTGTRGKRQANRSDVGHRIRPQKARTGFEPDGQADGAPALHASRYLTTPAFKLIPSLR
jgi:hypothetical protein